MPKLKNYKPIIELIDNDGKVIYTFNPDDLDEQAKFINKYLYFGHEDLKARFKYNNKGKVKSVYWESTATPDGIIKEITDDIFL